MTIINKIYTIKYSKGGVSQFADFRYSDGVFIDHSFRPSWVKTCEVPSLDGITEIEDFLKVIKEWSYGNQAEIILIDGNVPGYTSGKLISEYQKDAEDYFNKICLSFFKSEILIIIKKNKWKISYSWMGRPVLIKKDGEGEWGNVDSYSKDSMLIDNICNRFLTRVLDTDIELNLKSEHGYYSGDSFTKFISYINEDELLKLKVLIKI